MVGEVEEEEEEEEVEKWRLVEGIRFWRLRRERMVG